MRVIDADGHVEENPITFSDKYFDPAFRPHRPQVVPGTEEGLAYWMIDEQLFPRRVGRGCNNLGTPASINGKPVRHAQRKPDSLGSMELTNLKERLQIMDEENIWLQVLYPTLFLAYPLSSNVAYTSAMYTAYNRWLGDVLSGQERLKWVGVANLDDIPAAVKQVHEAKDLGAVGMMILGTAGDRLLDDESLLPFYEAVASEDLPLAVHVGWACPSLNNLYTHIYPSGVIPFLMPVLMGMVSMMSGGIFDRYPESARGLSGSGLSVGPFHSRALASSLRAFGEEFVQRGVAHRTDPKTFADGLHHEGQHLFQLGSGRCFVAAGTRFGGRRAIDVRLGHAARRPRAFRS